MDVKMEFHVVNIAYRMKKIKEPTSEHSAGRTGQPDVFPHYASRPLAVSGVPGAEGQAVLGRGGRWLSRTGAECVIPVGVV